MPRAQRLHVPAAHYHVTLRGNHRQNVFFSPADRPLFDEITAEVLDRFTARLHPAIDAYRRFVDHSEDCFAL